MSYQRKTVERWKYTSLWVFTFFLLLSLIPNSFDRLRVRAEFVSPLANDPTIIIHKPYLKENIDSWVDQYARQYFSGSRISEVKMIIHCLLHRESKHGIDNSHGDGGLAGGILQFHEATWTRMRRQMLDSGLIDEIGSRYDEEQAIHTTIFAMANGRALEWGPILRNYKGGDYATCQTPSWY